MQIWAAVGKWHAPATWCEYEWAWCIRPSVTLFLEPSTQFVRVWVRSHKHGSTSANWPITFWLGIERHVHSFLDVIIVQKCNSLPPNVLPAHKGYHGVATGIGQTCQMPILDDCHTKCAISHQKGWPGWGSVKRVICGKRHSAFSMKGWRRRCQFQSQSCQCRKRMENIFKWNSGKDSNLELDAFDFLFFCGSDEKARKVFIYICMIWGLSRSDTSASGALALIRRLRSHSISTAACSCLFPVSNQHSWNPTPNFLGAFTRLSKWVRNHLIRVWEGTEFVSAYEFGVVPTTFDVRTLFPWNCKGLWNPLTLLTHLVSRPSYKAEKTKNRTTYILMASSDVSDLFDFCRHPNGILEERGSKHIGIEVVWATLANAARSATGDNA